ncbi:uncharacterized protein LOC121866861 isoform X2 [Homarus americanus]|uniref:uncharacterized protein LOC121866861 isoform X2 n=1 Tax=Homarus americanus TaxID=6706 RepID=UPI001C439F4E|nr:uncharacterized protein LOC121866861 isoform X2 [Homarus americanus]
MALHRPTVATLALIFTILCPLSDSLSDSYGNDAVVFLGGDGEAGAVVVNAGARSTHRSHSNLSRFSSTFCTVDHDSCVLDDIPCALNTTCEAAFPNIILAMEIGKDSPVPTRPICTRQGSCSCGSDRCVSFSRQFGHDTTFYYCGPCGYVGSQCRNNTCTHELATCSGSYCQCHGTFYEFSYCKIPYMGYETALQLAIIICIVIACCLLIASIYSMIIGRRLRMIPRRLRRRRDEDGNQESPADDTPPTYDDVVENLPSYQDALQMAEVNPDEGITNPAFDKHDPLSPPYGNEHLEEEEVGRRFEEEENEKEEDHEEESREEEEGKDISQADEEGNGDLQHHPQRDEISLSDREARPIDEERSHGEASDLPEVHQSATRSKMCLQPIEVPLHEALNSHEC